MPRLYEIWCALEVVRALLALGGTLREQQIVAQPDPADEEPALDFALDLAEDAPLLIGHHSALSGTNQALGTNMKLGLELAFKEKNDAGGIRGRQLELEFRDDAYDPATAEQAARRHPITRGALSGADRKGKRRPEDLRA